MADHDNLTVQEEIRTRFDCQGRDQNGMEVDQDKVLSTNGAQT